MSKSTKHKTASEPTKVRRCSLYRCCKQLQIGPQALIQMDAPAVGQEVSPSFLGKPHLRMLTPSGFSPSRGDVPEENGRPIIAHSYLIACQPHAVHSFVFDRFIFHIFKLLSAEHEDILCGKGWNDFAESINDMMSLKFLDTISFRHLGQLRLPVCSKRKHPPPISIYNKVSENKEIIFCIG